MVAHIEDDEGDEDPNVSPPMGVLDVERKVQELVRRPERTESTIGGGIWVGQIASGARDVWIHVLRTGETARWDYGRIFDFRTVDLLSPETCVVTSN